MNLTVNQLPSRTWNHLRMNETILSLEETYENYSPIAQYDPEEISWDPDASVSSGVLLGELEPVLTNAKQGRGETRPGVTMKKPLVLSYEYDPCSHAASRVVLHAGENSRLQALLVLSSKEEGRTDSVLETRIYADDNAVVDLYVVELLGSRDRCLNSILGLCGKNAHINLVKLELGAKEIYSGVRMDLKGAEACFHSETGYHVLPGQVLDMNYVALHYGKNTNSQMEVNGTLEEGGKKIFRGTIDFQQGCAGAKAAENENVMLMGDEMVNQTIPVILCKEEDVEGSHGASIGQLDEKVLFYLASRGISREAAQAMIAQARIDAICEKIPVAAVADRVREFQKIRGTCYGEEL